MIRNDRIAEWRQDIETATSALRKDWNAFFFNDVPLPSRWRVNAQETLYGLSRTVDPEPRVVLMCVDTGKPLAACLNDESTEAAIRLLSL